MLTLTGNGRLTRDVALRSTRSGKSVATVSIASDRRDRSADALYVRVSTTSPRETTLSVSRRLAREP
jgi:single-stranded DNA-binding protein